MMKEKGIVYGRKAGGMYSGKMMHGKKKPVGSDTEWEWTWEAG